MKCNYFQDEKQEYEEIEIPEELLLMVRQTVAADRRKKAARIRMRILKTAGSVAAVLFLCLTIGVNSSYAFAETAVKIPIVKNVAKAVVIRSYRPEIIAVYEEYKVTGHGGETPGQPENGEPAEMIPTESGNDVPANEEAAETPEQTQPAEQEPEEALTGIEAWKAEMTPEKLKEVTEIFTPDMEKQYADTPEKLRTILLAKLPGKDIALYGYHENGSLTGTMLRVGDKCQYFDWNYMLEAGKLPELSCEDMDGDGEGEIVVFLYNKETAEGEITEENITVPEETEKSADATDAADAAADRTGTAGMDSAADTKTSDTRAADTKAADIKTADTKEIDTKAADSAGGRADTGTSGKKEKPENTGKTENTENAEKPGTTEKTQSDSTKPANAEEGSQETETEEKESVSGNDINQPAEDTEKPKPEEPQPGEIWVVSLKGEKWTAKIFTGPLPQLPQSAS